MLIAIASNTYAQRDNEGQFDRVLLGSLYYWFVMFIPLAVG